MSSAGGKLLIAILLIGFGFIYGIEMTKDGIEQIHGPLEQTVTHVDEQNVQEPDTLEVKNSEVMDPPSLQPATADKTIHHFANKTERFLSTTLQGGVELVVSLFELVVH